MEDNNPLNQKVEVLGTWFFSIGDVGPTNHSNGDPRLTLTYLTSRSNLLPNAFKWENFWKVDFFKTMETLVNFFPLIS